MAFGDTASSQGYAAAAGSTAGGPTYDNASIYFGVANLGPTSLTNTPTITPSSSAVPSAAQGGGGVTAPASGAGSAVPAYGGSGFTLSPLLLVAALLVGGALVVHMIHHKP